MTAEFHKDASCAGGCPVVILANNPQEYPSVNYNFFGNWELIENDTKLKIKSKYGTYGIWTIEELDYKKLKINNDSVRIEMSYKK